jgi:hypothetical protein
MKKLPIFPKAKNDNKWSQFTINCHENTESIMAKIIDGTSGLVRIDDLQAIEKILHKELNEYSE